MEKELGTANEIATADLSGGFYNLKEAVYNFLGNFFSWLSTHQGLVLIFMIGVLGIRTNYRSFLNSLPKLVETHFK